MFALVVLVVLGIGSGAAAAASRALTARSATDTLDAPLQLQAWTHPNCQGNRSAWTSFDDSVLARNISNLFIARSFRLNRTLVAQEQLDISVTNNYSTWYPDKDQLSYDSSSCTDFWQITMPTMGLQHITIHRRLRATGCGTTRACRQFRDLQRPIAPGDLYSLRKTRKPDRIRDHPRRPRRAPSDSHDDNDHAPGLASSKKETKLRSEPGQGLTHWMHGLICLRIRRHTAKFPAIFRTKKAGSSDTGVAERTHENALSRTRLVPASFRGNMYIWKYEFSNAP
ncbi:uncharacterized protein N7477_009018 [Penicillium maclennaniae]|uniref:uncharacterized protein n=1 Tax=Penicillium maclennaniae TaxID=1343394 RepID=UPI00253F9653|nr:uncharacterized protein N7477_009018 [Penicillium maclennaniae]KAJ5661402.1 hypothetical protein N7477_009018 [Penicillium maclennaniae]